MHELGVKIGCGAYVSNLKRTCNGDIKINDCSTLEELENGKFKVLDACMCLGLQTLNLTEKQAFDVSFGRNVTFKNTVIKDQYVSLRYNNKLLAIYEISTEAENEIILKPKIVFDGGVELDN